MSISNLLKPNSYSLYANNVAAPNVDLTTINHLPYPPVPPGGFLPTPLVANKLLRVNNTGTTTQWADISLNNIPSGLPGDYLQTIAPGVIAWDTAKVANLTPGLPNQILHTNSVATAAEWTSNLVIPGSLIVNTTADITSTLHVGGSGTFDSNCEFGQDVIVDNDLVVDKNITIVNNDLNVLAGDSNLQTVDVQNGVLKLGGLVGFSNQIIVSNGTTASWQNPSIIRLVRYCTYLSQQNLNAGVGPTAVNFSTTPISSLASASSGSVVGITQPNATQFTVGTLGTYDIEINGYLDTASTGIGNSIFTLSIEVGGIELANCCITNNSSYSFSGLFPSIVISAGQNVRILTRRLVGTGTLSTYNTSPSPSVPSFGSVISFTLVNTIA